jgi:hypothetical protein
MTLRPVFLTCADVTFATGISRMQQYRLFNEGKLQSAKIAGRRRVAVDSLEAYLGHSIDLPQRRSQS